MRYLLCLSWLLFAAWSASAQNWYDGLTYDRDGLCFINEEEQASTLRYMDAQKQTKRVILRWGYDKYMDLPYYNQHKNKKINRMYSVKGTVVAVIGEDNITIADLSGNGKILYSIERPGKNFVIGDATPDGSLFIASYLLADGSMGDLGLRLSDGSYKEKTLTYKPLSLNNLVCRKDGAFVQVYRIPEGDYHLATKSYEILMDDPNRNNFLKDVKLIPHCSRFAYAKKYRETSYLDLKKPARDYYGEWTDIAMGEDGEGYPKLFRLRSDLTGHSTNGRDFVYTGMQIKVDAVKQVKYKEEYTYMDVSYYVDGLENSANALLHIEKSDFLVLSGENISIVDCYGDGEMGSILNDFDFPGYNFITGDISPNGKFLVASYLKNGALGTLMMDLTTFTYKQKTISYKPKRLVKTVCTNEHFYELYVAPDGKYFISIKDCKKFWADPKSNPFIREVVPMGKDGVVTDILFDKGGLLFLGQNAQGDWYFGKYYASLKGEYWSHNIHTPGYEKACYYPSITTDKYGYYLNGSSHSAQVTDGKDIKPCRSNKNVLIYTDFHGVMLNHIPYEMKYDKTPNMHLVKAVRGINNQHHLLYWDPVALQASKWTLYFREE